MSLPPKTKIDAQKLRKTNFILGD